MYREGAAIGIPTYNGWHRVRWLLENLRQRTDQNGYPFAVYVVDDSGKEMHQSLVRDACREYGATFLYHPSNRGLPAAWNTLVRASDREMVVLLNDDVLMARDWLSYLSYAVMNNPKIGSASLNCRFITLEDVPEILKGPDAKVLPLNVRYENGVLIRNERFKEMPQQQDEWPGRVMCPAGCAFGFRRETYELVGGFDERYRCFYEETDFGVACAWRGKPTITLPVPHDNYHLWSATFASAPEINAGQIMNESREKFKAKWSQILGFQFNDAPDLHNPLMNKIPPTEVYWLDPWKRPRAETL
jgi:GT2 family glycosyltransferase